ncbi:MAG: hypothetical protein Q7U63_14770 [Polaromonas sp.]|uniref:hypothetical protein n=1 Tax=Polaromonas sp. TaxID=1869339 RepID=UPI0027229159|nr:hypothetical protein [Polaromonas sp.]MDO9115041.1 hypothetical protein [Polaromonas sp.]
MDFDSFLDRAWTDHAEQAAAVAERLIDPGLALLHQEDQVLPLAALALHVHGQHLGRWAEGLAFQQRLAALPLVAPEGATAQSLQRFAAVLRLAGGLADERTGLGCSDAARLTAMAAAALGVHDIGRARALLEEATAAVQANALPDADPAVRALAIAGNNLAGALEDLPVRSEAERALMVLAAQTGRVFWARAGSWLETERAEYRLAKTWLKAGDAAQAHHHARSCLDIVQANGNVALEHYFGLEVLGLAQRAAGDEAAFAQTVVQMGVTFDALDEGDKGWCRPTLAAFEP